MRLLLLVLAVSPCLAMRGDSSWVQQSAEDRLAIDFGFAPGGSAELVLRVHNLSNAAGFVRAFLVPPGGVPSFRFAREGLCAALEDGAFSGVVLDAEVRANETLQEAREQLEDGGFFLLAVLACPRGQVANYTLSYELYNPPSFRGGLRSHLSTSYAPNLLLFPLFTALWVALGVLWGINWFLHREQKSRLHLIITCWPAANVLYSAVESARWFEVDTIGQFLLPFTVAAIVLQVLSEVSLFLALLLIARGYGITNQRPLGTFGYVIGGCIALYAGLRLLATFAGGYLLLLTALPVFALIGVFVLVIWTTNGTLELAKTEDNIPQDSRALQLMRRFRWLMLSYIAMYALASFVSLFLDEFRFIANILFEFEELALAVVIGIVFRLRRNNLYYALYDTDDADAQMDSLEEPSAPPLKAEGEEMEEIKL